MTDRLSPHMLARLDQIHELNAARLNGMVAVPGILAAIEGQGEALFCADTTNTLLAGIRDSGGDVTEVAALLAVAIARLAKLEAGRE